LRDDLADTVRTARGTEPRTCQVERLIHYSGVATVKGAFKQMYRCHRRSLNHMDREGASQELPRDVINAPNFTDFGGRGVRTRQCFLAAKRQIRDEDRAKDTWRPVATAGNGSGDHQIYRHFYCPPGISTTIEK
jgi:hypothetical protein